MEAFQHFGIARQRIGEEFQGHGLAQSQVFRAVNLTHAAPAEQGHQSIAIGQFRASRDALAAAVESRLTTVARARSVHTPAACWLAVPTGE